MKKIISLLIVCVMLTASFTIYADESDTRFGILKSFEIMQGYGGGDLGLQRYVTRAEFTKMAIAASSFRNSVSSSMAVSPFPDSTYDKWYSPYVYLGVTNKLIAGYKDGTFKPDNYVLYEEGVAILLRLLGYQDSEFAYSWPTGQIGMAERIGLCKGVGAVAGQKLTRDQVSHMFYNLLKAKNKSGADYISVLEHSIVSDMVVISSYLQTDTVKKGYVNTSQGVYEVSEDFDYSLVGYKGDAVLKDNKIILFIPESTKKSTYNVFSVSGDNLILFKDGKISDYKLGKDEVLYNVNTKTTVSAMFSQFAPGDIIELHCNNNWDLEYVIYNENSLEGPLVIKNIDWYKSAGIKDNASVVKNGKISKISALKLNDVVYYSKQLQTVWATDKKVSGKYEAAIPDSDQISQINLSGVKYDIGTIEAFQKLSSGGEFKTGDRVTLVMGRDGKVCDVLSEGTGEIYAVYNVLGGNVLVYNNGEISTLNIKNSTTAYINSSTNTFGNIKSMLETGYTIEVTKDISGNISYITVAETTLDGPYTAKNNSDEIGIDGNTVIFKNGKKISRNDIVNNDIMYHSESLNMVWVYNDTVTGVYEDAYPNKNTPASVTVSGTSYDIEGIKAYSALGANGNLQFGDTVTLLLGKDGKIADVIAREDTDIEEVVFMIGGGSKEFTDKNGKSYSAPYVLVLDKNVVVREYESSKDYTNYYKSQIAELTFEDGKAVLSEKSAETVGGIFTVSSKTLGSVKYSDDVKIIDIAKGDGATNSLYKKIYPQRLDGIYISSNKVLHTEKDAEGKITTLFLNDITGDAYSYGIVTLAENNSGGMSVSGSYTFFEGSLKQTLRTSGKSFSVYSGNPVQIKKSSAGVDGMVQLTSLGKVTEITQSAVKIQGKSYKYLNDMAIYYHDGIEYQAITIDRFKEVSNGKNVTAYSEKTDITSARVRVIVVK